MADGSNLSLFDRDVWGIYGPNPPELKEIFGNRYVLQTRTIWANDYKDQFKEFGFDVFIGYGTYDKSNRYIPYQNIGILGYWNHIYDLTSNTTPGEYASIILDFEDRAAQNPDGVIVNYLRQPIKTPGGIPDVPEGVNLTWKYALLMLRSSECIFVRTWNRTRWACNNDPDSTNGFAYSGWWSGQYGYPPNSASNAEFQAAVDRIGHTFEHGICIYNYSPIARVKTPKHENSLTFEIEARDVGITKHFHHAPQDSVKGTGYSHIKVYAGVEGTVTPSISGHTGLSPSTVIDPGSTQVFVLESIPSSSLPMTYTKTIDPRSLFGYSTTNNNDNKRGKNVRLRTWFRRTWQPGISSGDTWRPSGPDAGAYISDGVVAGVENPFPPSRINKLVINSYNLDSSTRENKYITSLNIRTTTSDPDSGDSVDKTSCGITAGRSLEDNLNTVQLWTDAVGNSTKIMASKDLAQLISQRNGNNSLRTIIYQGLYLNITANDKFVSNGSYQYGSSVNYFEKDSYYVLEMEPEISNVSVNKSIGVNFTLTINATHPYIEECRYALSIKSLKDNVVKNVLAGFKTTAADKKATYSSNNSVTVNLSSLYGTSYAGSEFQVNQVEVVPSRSGVSKGRQTSTTKFRYNDIATTSASLASSSGTNITVNLTTNEMHAVSNYEYIFTITFGGVTMDVVRKSSTKSYATTVDSILNELALTNNKDQLILQYISIKTKVNDGYEGGVSQSSVVKFQYDRAPGATISGSSSKGLTTKLTYSKVNYPQVVKYHVAVKPTDGTSWTNLVGNISSPTYANGSTTATFDFNPASYFNDTFRGKTFTFKVVVISSTGIKSEATGANFIWGSAPNFVISGITPSLSPSRSDVVSYGRVGNMCNVSITNNGSESITCNVYGICKGTEVLLKSGFTCAAKASAATGIIDLTTKFSASYSGNTLQIKIVATNEYAMSTTILGSTSETATTGLIRLMTPIMSTTGVEKTTQSSCELLNNIVYGGGALIRLTNLGSYTYNAITLAGYNTKVRYYAYKSADAPSTKFLIAEDSLASSGTSVVTTKEISATDSKFVQGNTYKILCEIVTGYSSSNTNGFYKYTSQVATVQYRKASNPTAIQMLLPNKTFDIGFGRPPLILKIPSQSEACHTKFSKITVVSSALSINISSDNSSHAQYFDGKGSDGKFAHNSIVKIFLPNNINSNANSFTITIYSAITGYNSGLTFTLNMSANRPIVNHADPNVAIFKARAELTNFINTNICSPYGVSPVLADSSQQITYQNNIGYLLDSVNKTINAISNYSVSGVTNYCTKKLQVIPDSLVKTGRIDRKPFLDLDDKLKSYYNVVTG